MAESSVDISKFLPRRNDLIVAGANIGGHLFVMVTTGDTDNLIRSAAQMGEWVKLGLPFDVEAGSEMSRQIREMVARQNHT